MGIKKGVNFLFLIIVFSHSKNLYSVNNIYHDSEGSLPDSAENQGGCPLENRRQMYESWKTMNPETEALLFSSAKAEVGNQGEEAIQAYMESVFNRAMATNKSLYEILSDPGYYPDQTKNQLSTETTANGQYSAILEQVLNGSNVSQFATDNASADVAEHRKEGGNHGVDIGGEYFYINANGSGGEDTGVPAHEQFANQAQSACSNSLAQQDSSTNI